MELQVISGVAQRSSPQAIVDAITIEQDIINYCRSNYHMFMDAERHDLLKGAEANALARLLILEEIARA